MKKNLKKYEIAENILTYCMVFAIIAAIACILTATIIWHPGTPSPLAQNLIKAGAVFFCVAFGSLPIFDYIFEKSCKAYEAARRAERVNK